MSRESDPLQTRLKQSRRAFLRESRAHLKWKRSAQGDLPRRLFLSFSSFFFSSSPRAPLSTTQDAWRGSSEDARLLAEPAMTGHASDSSRKSRLPVLSISANRFPFYLLVIVGISDAITRIMYDHTRRPRRLRARIIDQNHDGKRRARISDNSCGN